MEQEEKIESVNNPELDVLGGIFTKFKIEEWEIQMFRKFIKDPFKSTIVGVIERYMSDILDDWKYYDPDHLDWIHSPKTLQFWWSYTKDTSFETFVYAVNLEQYDIADKCKKDPIEKNFKWPKTKLTEIKDITKYLSYIDLKWYISTNKWECLTQFPLTVTIKIISDNSDPMGYNKIKYGYHVGDFLKAGLMDLLPVLHICNIKADWDKKLLQYRDILIQCKITIRYNFLEIKNLTNNEMEQLLSINSNIEVDNLAIIYRLETIRRKMIKEKKL